MRYIIVEIIGLSTVGACLQRLFDPCMPLQTGLADSIGVSVIRA